MEGLNKCIRDVISEGRPLIMAPRDTVFEAIQAMARHHEAAVLVATTDGLTGIFTERDYLVRVVAAGRSAETTLIGSVMTPDPDTLQLGDSVTYAINRMAVRGYRNVPIVDERGQPVALVGVRDVVGHLAEIFGGAKKRPVDAQHDPWVDIGGG